MKFVIILVFAIFCFGFVFDWDYYSDISQVRTHTTQPSTVAKKKALTVLENNCNSCHLKKNRSIIFDLQNMSKKARDIHTQVFVKKRMPQGKVKLTEDDSQILQVWLKEELR